MDEGVARERRACAGAECGYVQWGNPVPVVGALVEHEGDILLARNAAWPEGFFALVTGYLEANEDPRAGVQLQTGVIGIVPSLPKPSSIFWIGGPLKATATVFCADRLGIFSLFLHAQWRSMKLKNGICTLGSLSAAAGKNINASATHRPDILKSAWLCVIKNPFFGNSAQNS
jgi:hypothetical protein